MKTAFYFKQPKGKGKREFICSMNPEQRQQFALYQTDKKNPRPELTDEQQAIFLRMISLDEATKPSNPNRANMRVDVLAEHYLADRKNTVSKVKFSEYERSINSFCAFCGALPLTDVTPATVRRWRNANPGWKSSSTVRSRYKVVLQMFNWAVQELILTNSPLAGLGRSLETEAPDAKRMYCLYDAERDLMLANAEPAFRTIITVMLGTGRRPDEISNIKKSEVTRNSEGVQWRIAKHKKSKIEAKPETIYLTPEIAKITEDALADESNKSEFLFVQDNGKPWTTATIGDKWNQTKKIAKLETDSKPYSCRHSYITLALHNGVPMPVVAHMVGNSVEIIARFYSHIEAQHVSVYFQAAMQAVKPNKNYRSE